MKVTPWLGCAVFLQLHDILYHNTNDDCDRARCKFPQLYDINVEQNCSISFMKQRSEHLSFRRWLNWEGYMLSYTTILMMIVIEQDGSGKNLGISLSNLLIWSYVGMTVGLTSNKFRRLRYLWNINFKTKMERWWIRHEEGNCKFGANCRPSSLEQFWN